VTHKLPIPRTSSSLGQLNTSCLFSHKKGHNPCKWNHRVDTMSVYQSGALWPHGPTKLSRFLKDASSPRSMPSLSQASFQRMFPQYSGSEKLDLTSGEDTGYLKGPSEGQGVARGHGPYFH
jgi:hypothetical protein